MTLPYPDSPDVDENIATSIERVKDNLDYLDELIGSGNIKAISSNAINMSIKTNGTQTLLGVGFQPKAMICIATHSSTALNSWGAASQASTTTSVDCACVAQDSSYAGVASNLEFINFYYTSTSYLVGSVCTFLSDGVRFNWTNSAVKTGGLGNLMYIFFG